MCDDLVSTARVSNYPGARRPGREARRHPPISDANDQPVADALVGLGVSNLFSLRADGDCAALDEPRQIRFLTGRRRKSWVKNVIAIGLSAGFLEPLESTSIHLIQTAVLKLLALFPDKTFEPADRNAFNRHTIDEYKRIRDFLILHYKVTNRTDPFWRQCREMDVPDSLREAIELFESRGRMFITQDHLFNAPSWLAVMLGQGLRPRGYDPLADTIAEEELKLFMADVRNEVATTAAAMPTHAEYISRFCASGLYAG